MMSTLSAATSVKNYKHKRKSKSLKLISLARGNPIIAKSFANVPSRYILRPELQFLDGIFPVCMRFCVGAAVHISIAIQLMVRFISTSHRLYDEQQIFRCVLTETRASFPFKHTSFVKWGLRGGERTRWRKIQSPWRPEITVPSHASIRHVVTFTVADVHVGSSRASRHVLELVN